MGYDKDRVDETVMALLYLTMFDDHGLTRAWKGADWDVLGRLYERGWIDNPRNKNKSVVLTDQGKRMAKELFDRFFAKKD